MKIAGEYSQCCAFAALVFSVGVLNRENKMKKWPLIFAAYALLLAGCAHFDKGGCRQCAVEGFDPRTVKPPQPLLPNVFVVDRRYLVVDQEPIRLNRGDIGADGRVTVAWALPAGTPYAFVGDKGIVIVPVPPGDGVISKDRAAPKAAPGAPPKCERSPQAKVVACTFVLSPGRSVFKYTINVENRENPREVVEPLDPFIESNY